MANPFEYQFISPLVSGAQQTGSRLAVSFKCPVTGATAHANSDMSSMMGRMTEQATSRAKSNMLWSARSSLMGALRSVAGTGFLGRAVTDAAQGAMYSAGGSTTSGAASQSQYSEEDKQKAIVKAFRDVSGQFRWEAAQNRWVSQRAPGGSGAAAGGTTEFAKQLDRYPVKEAYDKTVLARMLAEISSADGSLGDEERQFVAGFVDSSMGTVDEIAARPPLSKVELEEVSHGQVRDTMLMTAWGVALSDEDLAQEELALIGNYAQGLGIAPNGAAELKRHAQDYIMEKALEGVFEDADLSAEERDGIFSLGQGLGMSREDTERAIIRFRKSRGLL